MFPPERCKGRQRWRSSGLGEIAHHQTANEQHNHHGQQYPAGARPAGHAAERDGERCRQHSDGQQPEETDKRRRIRVRMCAVGIEETAAVGPQILDEF
jgi:hypothetical protein